MKYLNLLSTVCLFMIFLSCQNPENNNHKDSSITQQADDATLSDQTTLSPEESILLDSSLKTTWPKLKTITEKMRGELILRPMIEIINPEEQKEYDRFISDFRNRYGSVFNHRSDSFQLTIKSLYRGMMTDLELRRSVYGANRYSAIRFYPAVSDGGKGNKTLYLVFLGEVAEDSQYGPIRYSLQDKPFYGIFQKNYDIRFLDDLEKAQAINYDIQRFKSDFGPIFHDTSFYFTVSKFYQALKKIDPNESVNWNNDTSKTSNLKYGLTIYPALRRDTLLFVVKPHLNASSTSRPLQKGYNYLDHIDPCPDKCPENKL